MALISLAIGMACSDISPQQMNACSKALEATTKQIQLYQTDEQIEGYVTDYGKKIVVKTTTTYLSQSTIEVVGGAAYIYKIVKDKGVELKLPTLGLCDSAVTKVTTNSYSFNVKWNLPW